MRRARRAALLLAVSLALGGAGAQNLDAYRATTGALDQAVRDRPLSAVKSLADVDQATTAFEQLSGSLTGSVVLDGTRVAIKNARIAVGRSQADLEAQVAQVRGLLRRALYEQLLSDLPHATPAGLTLLGQEFGLSAADRSELLQAAQGGRPDVVTALLERAAATKVSQSLEDADPARPSSAYLGTARALSWFTTVQDSPRAAGLRVEDFSGALARITQRQGAAYARSRSQLLARASRFEAAASQAVVAARRGAALPTVGAPTPTPTARPATPSPAVTPRAPAGAAGTATGEALLAALGAAGHGDVRGAQAGLQDAVLSLGGMPAELQRAPGFSRFADGLRAAANLPFVRPADVRAQLGAWQNLRAQAASRPESALDRAAAGAQQVWGGWLSGVVWVLLALLAFVPLYLLNLAFGGRNPYWRAIGVAFTLLLLPAMLEGLASLGAWVGAMTGFGALANLSLLQSPLAGSLWALSVALAVGLSIYGFRGLCVQFGLLRGSTPASSPRPAPAVASSTVEWDEEV